DKFRDDVTDYINKYEEFSVLLNSDREDRIMKSIPTLDNISSENGNLLSYRNIKYMGNGSINTERYITEGSININYKLITDQLIIESGKFNEGQNKTLHFTVPTDKINDISVNMLDNSSFEVSSNYDKDSGKVVININSKSDKDHTETRIKFNSLNEKVQVEFEINDLVLQNGKEANIDWAPKLSDLTVYLKEEDSKFELLKDSINGLRSEEHTSELQSR